MSPLRRRTLLRALFAAHPLPDRAAWEAAVLALWRGAGYREERYAALALTGYTLYAQHQDRATLPLYRELIVHGAWWDYVDETDLDLLTEVIEPNLAETGFFLRKAIGWALRSYAWTDPDWVRAYVAAHESRLSGLSRREALKNID